jgi:hypothetical protein
VLPRGVHAVQLTSAAPTRAIELVAGEPARTAIARAIEQTTRFTVVAPGGGSMPLATVRVRAGQLELATPSGVPLGPATAVSAHSLAELTVNLRMLTAAQSLRELASQPGQLHEAALEVAWGVVEHGRPIMLPAAGALLGVGARVFVRVTNNHPQGKKLYVSLIDIGIAQRIQVLTDGSGYELEPGQSFTYGESADHRLDGVEVGWSSELPGDTVRTEAIMVIATEAPIDLAGLETPGTTHGWAHGVTRSATSPLAQLLNQFQYGGVRNIKKSKLVPDGYLVHYLSFELSPWPLPAPGAEFLRDDRPPHGVQLSAPRGAPPAAHKLAIRITGLAVNDARSSLGSSNIRLDTLVITRAGRRGDTPYRAATSRFRNIMDAKLLAPTNPLVFQGDARGCLDLRVWVSRDREGSEPLSELLVEHARDRDFAAAVEALRPVAAADSAAAIVAAIAATATLTAFAWRVLAAELPTSIGIYQTSLLAGDGGGFSAGRHPPQGVLTAHGFALGYEVISL